MLSLTWNPINSRGSALHEDFCHVFYCAFHAWSTLSCSLYIPLLYRSRCSFLFYSLISLFRALNPPQSHIVSTTTIHWRLLQTASSGIFFSSAENNKDCSGEMAEGRIREISLWSGSLLKSWPLKWPSPRWKETTSVDVCCWRLTSSSCCRTRPQSQSEHWRLKNGSRESQNCPDVNC